MVWEENLIWGEFPRRAIFTSPISVNKIQAIYEKPRVNLG